MAPPFRLAILETDTGLDQTRAKYGCYGGVFTSLLHKAADASNIPRERFELTGWDVVSVGDGPEEEVEEMGGLYDWKRRRGYPKIEDIDGILITGSRYDSYADNPWTLRLVEYTKQVIASNRVRVVGVCFGHQIVGRALGAKVAKSEGTIWEASVCSYPQTAKGKELFGGKENLHIFQMHKDIVYYYPEGVEELGSSGPCKVQGMYMPKKIITVQGHPEFTEEIVRELLHVRHGQGVFSDEQFTDMIGRVGKEQDGVLVAQGFLKFLLEG